MRCHSSSGWPTNLWLAAAPALFTRMSTPPYFAAISAAMRSTSAGVGDIADQHESLAAGYADLGGQLLQLSLAARAHSHVGAGRGQRQRDRTPDPAACARDERNSVIEW